jgi:hypothetical protein
MNHLRADTRNRFYPTQLPDQGQQIAEYTSPEVQACIDRYDAQRAKYEADRVHCPHCGRELWECLIRPCGWVYVKVDPITAFTFAEKKKIRRTAVFADKLCAGPCGQMFTPKAPNATHCKLCFPAHKQQMNREYNARRKAER